MFSDVIRGMGVTQSVMGVGHIDSLIERKTPRGHLNKDPTAMNWERGGEGLGP